METKVCSKCQEEKKLSNFTKDKKTKDGLDLYCKECKAEMFKSYISSGKYKKITRKNNLKVNLFMDQLNFEFVESFVDEGIKLNKLGIFKTKKCTKCNCEYELTRLNFTFNKSNKDGYSGQCKKCLYSGKKLYAEKRKSRNLCRVEGCNNNREENCAACEFHLCYQIILTQKSNGRFNNLNTTEKRKEFSLLILNKLKYQNYKCALTGEKLIFGKNISLDHIFPFSKGGSDNIENLQWITLKANLNKGVKQ